MELLQVENLTFTYPKQTTPALQDVSFTIADGEFVVLCGASGCGKSTLLKLLKREIAPHGEKQGNIRFSGVAQSELDERTGAGAIGFVAQNPDGQIVTDKVWHELAFGLENLGVPAPVIRRRVGEMASYFGIQSWYHQATDALSGGQKQMLNLAGVMTMQPKLLLLDEPTSQLDPIAADHFIDTLQKLNREFGLTILLVEHRLEEVFPIADRIMVLEAGKLICNGAPSAVAAQLRDHPMSRCLPSAARIWAGLCVDCPCPLTVREGKDFLHTHFSHRKGAAVPAHQPALHQPVIEAKGVWFRYEKKSPDVLRNLHLTVCRGEVFSLLGGNGAGKTTTLNILAGLDRPYAGKLKIQSKPIGDYSKNSLYRRNLTMLPQNPQALFLKQTVREDLEEILKSMPDFDGQVERTIQFFAEKYAISHLLEKHPYDLSGGELQKCALVKLLLTKPSILLLDEPTKGMDAVSRAQFAKQIAELQAEGVTIVMVTHDVEFAAQVSTRCALFFDGEIVSAGTPNEFFSDHHFYTTAASRISRGLFDNAVLCSEIIALCDEK